MLTRFTSRRVLAGRDPLKGLAPVFGASREDVVQVKRRIAKVHEHDPLT